MAPAIPKPFPFNDMTDTEANQTTGRDSGTDEILAAITPIAAISLLVFCLLYTPCVAAIASVKRELGRKWAAAIVLFQCSIAWVTALAVKLIISLFGV